MQKDLDFIAGTFFDYDIPKNQQYLLKYFRTDLQAAFLRYYLIYNSWTNFVDHTGMYCTKRALQKLTVRFNRITEIYAKAQEEFTEESIELLFKIESGKYRP